MPLLLCNCYCCCYSLQEHEGKRDSDADNEIFTFERRTSSEYRAVH